MADYVADFIINNGLVSFETGDGRRWKMRQPTPEEMSAGDSAARLAREAVLDDNRLKALAKNAEAHRREAEIRASAARATYLLPLLLLDEDGRAVFDVHDAVSMAEFEATEPGIVTEMVTVFWGPITEAMIEAKKKSQSPLSGGSSSAKVSASGPSARRRN